MAKTVIEDLMALLTPDEQAVVKAKLDANPGLVVRDRKMGELFGIYMGEDEPPAPVVVEPGKPAPIIAAPAVPIVPAVPATVTGESAVLAKLSELSTSLDTKLAEIKKEFVPISKLGDYRTEMLGSAIKAADDYAQVREDHRAEFGKPIDRTAFEKFVADQRTAGIGYKDMKSAHDAFVAEERTQLKIATGIKDGIKVQASSTAVPGQTLSVALSPAQQAIAKQKAAAASAGDGKSNAMVAAEKLARLRQSREEGEVSVQ